MATLALAAAGAALGGAVLPAGFTVLGATVTGATIGGQLGALAGSFVDQALFGASGQTRTYQGPRLAELRVTASTEGAPIPRLYGRARLGGQVIWATPFEEETVTTETGGGGGGGKGRPRTPSTRQIEYRYYANFAVALAEGEIAGIGRVWADGHELDLTDITYRLYTGSEDQHPDSLIVAREGADEAPAYRGTAYIVFERLPLADFGNRLPQLSFEVFRTVDDFHELVRGVVLIPGSGEFVYAPKPVTRLGAGGERVYENVHTRQGGSDWRIGIDQLEAALPNAKSVSLVVSWFGTDLRVAQCEVRPGVEIAAKSNHPFSWSVAGVSRTGAHVVSLDEGRPAYGGTPSDQTVIDAIRDLSARGFSVTLNPFILMDVPEGNALPNPYDASPSQPAYPWRGRITVDPAPGVPGSPDKSAAAAVQIASFVGTCAPADFSLSGDQVVYSGPAEWSLRRQVLHYAWLAKAAGGVDAFVIGSELRGLTQVRDGAASYPFVAALVALAADVKSVLGPSVKVTYAADWSEYFGHQPQDGSGDVFFNLDPLWSSPDIDAIGIDLYWPLADWRDGREHIDLVAGARSIYDLIYLKSNIAGGEGYDWYYASAEDREEQIRTPITDGAGKPWVFRYKDIRSWWLEQHFHRPGGIESATPTGWVPQSKPFWLTEVGCPAVDKGANQPNVFIDPKSAESALPYFSGGRRDDLIQRRYLQALIEGLDPDHPEGLFGANPMSSVYAGLMVDLDHIHAYAWDTRPFPAFPNDTDAWGDGANWRLGHWLNGRIAGVPLGDLVAAILNEHGFSDHDADSLEGVVPGYAIDRIMSARESLQPLELGYFFDAIETGGMIAFRHRGAADAVAELDEADMVERRSGDSLLTLLRRQETELPASAKVTYIGAESDYQQAVAEARRLTGASGRVAQADLAVVLEAEEAAATAESWLFEAWASRERATFTLPPSLIALEPGDVVSIVRDGRSRPFRITEVGEHGERDIEALSIDPEIYARIAASGRPPRVSGPLPAGQPLAEFLDLPLLRGDEPENAGYVAAAETPWPGAVAFYSSPEATGYALRALSLAPAVMGTTLDPLALGPLGRIDRAARIRVVLDHGELVSVTGTQLLAGANAAAVGGPDSWEIVQFEAATLLAPRTYELSGLLRGQAGSDADMQAPLAAGARFVLLNAAVTRVDLAAAEIGLPYTWRYGPANRDLGDAGYVERLHAFRGLGRRPLSPVHVRGRRSGGDLVIEWIRRTRIGGDSWDTIEVPLGEDAERYEVDILDGTTVMRTLSSSSPFVTYTATDQIADFGGPQPSISIRIYQLGAAWGRGSATFAVV